MQRRSGSCGFAPGLLYASVGGHISSGELPRQAIVREFQEESGLDISAHLHRLRYLFTFREDMRLRPDYIDREFCNVYLLPMDLDLRRLTLQPGEVQSAEWIPYPSFRAALVGKDQRYFIMRRAAGSWWNTWTG